MRRLTAALVIAGLAAAPLLTLSFGVNGRGAGQAAATQQVTLPGAARFLTQATFGPTDSSISDVQSAGYAAWIDQQESMPVSDTHLAFMQRRLAALQAISPSARNTSGDFYDSFWRQTATAPDQLRQRVKLALSEIFVISFSGQVVDPKGFASYYDVLGANAFGNYRTLLEQVTLHPMMGSYLSYISNAKENLATGQTPDENYARETQQLMSIGLYQLNLDGSNQTYSSGVPIPSYSDADVKGLSKVFTGFGWFSSHTTGPGSSLYFYGGHKDSSAYVTPMSAYPAMHSTSEKSFLGTTISASTTSDPTGDLKIALDTIFNHPNVGPFIGKQLIQKLVTSNPSPAYIARVAAVFNNDGAGVRGNLGAVVKAILMDPEARDDTAVSNPTFGKLREPVVRLGNWMRAFNATSDSGWWLVGSTSALVSFNQSPLTAPSVFNFWRPGYSPPNTTMGGLNLVAPEFQTVNVISVVGYLNAIRLAVTGGVGTQSTTTGAPDVHSAYVNEMAIARDAGALTDRINTLVLYGQMSASLRARIIAAVNQIKVPGPPATATLVNKALKSRVGTAVYLAFGSPEYMAQR